MFCLKSHNVAFIIEMLKILLKHSNFKITVLKLGSLLDQIWFEYQTIFGLNIAFQTLLADTINLRKAVLCGRNGDK